jgi:glycosyltransferase involved in cell wall biosynthesis
MIHLFPTFSREAEASPLGQEMRESDLPHRFFSGSVRLHYRNRAELILLRYPQLTWFALRAAIASLLLSRPRPQVLLLNSDIEILVFGVLRGLLFRRSTRIILTSFIYTHRPSAWRNALRRLYFRWVLSFTDRAVVHSRLEAERYPSLFGLPANRFTYVPWGTSITLRDKLLRDPSGFRAPGAAPYILSAGRSGRDYATLFRAVANLGIDLRVVCDLQSAFRTPPDSASIHVLPHCYGNDYILQLFGAEVVAVPLAVQDISAGQMVVVQAMALGKAIVVTRTPTIEDYVTDGDDALLVPPGDATAMEQAIRRLLEDPSLCERLGRNAMARFERSYTTRQHVRALVGLARGLMYGEQGRKRPR